MIRIAVRDRSGGKKAGARVNLEGDGGFSVIVVMVAWCIQRQPQQIVHFKSGQLVSVLRLNKAA